MNDFKGIPILPRVNDLKESLANKQLISAAPELLEALQCLVKRCNNTSIDASEAYYRSVQAINKALGL